MFGAARGREGDGGGVLCVRRVGESGVVCASSPVTASSGWWLRSRRVLGGGWTLVWGFVWRSAPALFGSRTDRAALSSSRPATGAVGAGRSPGAVEQSCGGASGRSSFPGPCTALFSLLGFLCLGVADTLFWVTSGGSGVAPPPGTDWLVRRVVVGTVCGGRPGGRAVRWCVVLVL